MREFAGILGWLLLITGGLFMTAGGIAFSIVWCYAKWSDFPGQMRLLGEFNLWRKERARKAPKPRHGGGDE